MMINGYMCVKNQYNEYFIGGSDRYYDSLVTISLNHKAKKGDEISILFGRVSNLITLGKIKVSNKKEGNTFETIGMNSLSQEYGNNTILENAINFNYADPKTDKKRQVSIQQVLTMLNDLGIELTPTEKMEMLKGKKQYLQNELNKINEQLKTLEDK